MPLFSSLSADSIKSIRGLRLDDFCLVRSTAVEKSNYISTLYRRNFVDFDFQIVIYTNILICTIKQSNPEVVKS